jgi:uncharacterized membrane protein YfcA
MIEFDPPLLIVGGLAVLLAGFLRGLTGFGFALVAAPIVSTLVEPQIVVPMILIHGTLTSIPLIIHARDEVQPLHIWPLMAGAIAGAPFGSYLLLVLDADALRLLIGIVAFGFALLFLVGFSRKVHRERFAFVPVGFLSGLLNGSSSLAGPPVILFFANQGIPPATFRANILVLFFATNIATIFAFAIGGLFSVDAFVLALAFGPSLVVGTYLGARYAGRVNVRLFRDIALSVVMGSGIIAIVDGSGLL